MRACCFVCLRSQAGILRPFCFAACNAASATSGAPQTTRHTPQPCTKATLSAEGAPLFATYTVPGTERRQCEAKSHSISIQLPRLCSLSSLTVYSPAAETRRHLSTERFHLHARLPATLHMHSAAAVLIQLSLLSPCRDKGCDTDPTENDKRACRWGPLRSLICSQVSSLNSADSAYGVIARQSLTARQAAAAIRP